MLSQSKILRNENNRLSQKVKEINDNKNTPNPNASNVMGARLSIKRIGVKGPINNEDGEVSQKFSLIICVFMFILGFILTK